MVFLCFLVGNNVCEIFILVSFEHVKRQKCSCCKALCKVHNIGCIAKEEILSYRQDHAKADLTPSAPVCRQGRSNYLFSPRLEHPDPSTPGSNSIPKSSKRIQVPRSSFSETKCTICKTKRTEDKYIINYYNLLQMHLFSDVSAFPVQVL